MLSPSTLRKLQETAGNGVMFEATERAELRTALLVQRTYLEQLVRAVRRLPLETNE